jgi:hypothetical protein
VAATRESVLFDIHDFKVYPLLTDSASASPTYGAAVDCPGIAEASFEPNLVTAELKGDARIIAKRGRTDRFNVSWTYGKVALDVLTVVLGGTITDIGTGSNEEAVWALTGPAPLPYFKVEFKVDDVEMSLATVHVVLYKCQLTGGTLFNQSSDNFGQPTMQAEAIQPDHATTPMGKIRFLEAATNLSA